MGKLAEFIVEAAIKINPEKIITGLTKITDVTEIDKLVSSGKKDDRISIAANPNLNLEQQTKLSTDRVEMVRHALCFNSNLDTQLAKKLLDEDIDRLTFISKYGKKHLIDTILLFLKDKRLDNPYIIVNNILNSSDISDTAIEYIIKHHPDILVNPGNRKVYTNKNLTKKSALMLLHHLKDEEYKGDATLSRLIINNPDHIKESDIIGLDWKNNSELQAAISGRKDFSRDLVYAMVDNLLPDTRLEATNPHMHDSEILNKVIEKYLTFKLSFRNSFDIFKETTDIALDPQLMLDIVKYLNVTEYEHYAKFFLNNSAFQIDGIREIPLTSNNFRDILAAPATDANFADEIIKKMVVDPNTADSAIWGLASRKVKLRISKISLKKLLDTVSVKSSWFEFVIFGEEVDTVLDNLEAYKKYYTDYNYKSAQPKFALLSSLVKNKNLTTQQRKKIFSIYQKLDPSEILPHTKFVSMLSLYDTTQDPALFRMSMTQGGNIWDVWDVTTGLTYYQFNPEIIKIIDELVLNTTNVPAGILKIKNSHVFSDWVDNNNKEGIKMTDEMAIKYLIHFIKVGNDYVRKIIFGGYIDEKWMVPEVSMCMYEVTNNPEYLPQLTKDIFLF